MNVTNMAKNLIINLKIKHHKNGNLKVGNLLKYRSNSNSWLDTRIYFLNNLEMLQEYDAILELLKKYWNNSISKTIHILS